MTEKWLLAKYKVTNQEQIKLKASLTTTKNMYAMNIATSLIFIIMENIKINSETFYFSDFSMVTARYMLTLVTSRSFEDGSGTWILQKLKQRLQYFNWNPYQPWSDTPHKW